MFQQFQRLLSLGIGIIVMLCLMAGSAYSNNPLHIAAATEVATPEVVATILVNTLSDDPTGCPKTCSLRSAIATATDEDVIGFDSKLSGVVKLTQPLTIEHNLTIAGPGADKLAIDGNQKVKVFIIDDGEVYISGLTIQHGFAEEPSAHGAGIDNFSTLTIGNSVIADNVSEGSGGGIGNYGNLTITDSTISGNSAKTFGGGGIDSNGKLTITNCTVAGNSAEQNGGGILITDGNGGQTTITNTTIANNKVEFSGAGLANGSTDHGGDVTIISSTIAKNEAGFEGGGIYNSSGKLTIGGSIVAGNTDTFKRPDVSGKITSKGFNLIGKLGDAKGFIKSDQRDVDPLLGPLDQARPGTTSTMEIAKNSPAVGKGGKTCPKTDQRGVTRKKPCDVGAYETAS